MQPSAGCTPAVSNGHHHISYKILLKNPQNSQQRWQVNLSFLPAEIACVSFTDFVLWFSAYSIGSISINENKNPRPTQVESLACDPTSHRQK